MGRVDTAFSLLAGNQKLYGWLVGTPDLLQWAAWCTLHHNQATAFMSWALYILVKTMLQCLPWIKEGVAATVGLMIAGSSSRLHSLKVLSAKEEQKVSLRKSCLAAAESCKEGSIRKRLFLSNISWSQKQSNCRQHICILNLPKSVTKLRFCNEAARNIFWNEEFPSNRAQTFLWPLIVVKFIKPFEKWILSNILRILYC